MHTTWKGSIGFGLVSIPAKLYKATDPKDATFHQVHASDAGRIRYKRFCEGCGEETPYSDVAKGVELPDGGHVVLTEEDFADLPLSTSKAIEVLQFVPAAQLDPIFYDGSYYIEPENAGAHAYVLLRDALAKSGKVGICKIAMRQRESLAALRVRDGLLVLTTLVWAEEVRAATFPFMTDDALKVRPQELKMATSLIDSMSADFDPAAHTNGYRAALDKLVAAKTSGKPAAAKGKKSAAKPAASTLMATLTASLEAASSPKVVPARRRPARSKPAAAAKPAADKPAAVSRRKSA